MEIISMSHPLYIFLPYCSSSLTFMILGITALLRGLLLSLSRISSNLKWTAPRCCQILYLV